MRFLSSSTTGALMRRHKRRVNGLKGADRSDDLWVFMAAAVIAMLFFVGLLMPGGIGPV
jgi:hypothetical protein